MTPEERKVYMKEYNAKHYAANQEKLREKAKVRMAAKYHGDLAHRAKVLEYQKARAVKKADEIRKYQREYKEKNRPKLNAYNAKLKRERYATDPIFRERRKQIGRDFNKTPEWKAYIKAYRAKRMKEHPELRHAENLDRSIRSMIKKGGGTKTHNFSSRFVDIAIN